MSPPLPKLDAIPPDIVTVEDYAAAAKARLSEAAWAYLAGGAGDESTLEANRAAFARVKLRSRILADLDGGHTRLDLFGRRFEAPILLAPVAFQTLFHPEGERASLLAAAALGLGMAVSTQASIAIEELAAQAQAPLWFQIYMQPTREATLTLVRRAEAAGCAALVLTGDAPISGLRPREQRARFSLPPGIEAANLRGLPPAPAHQARPGGPILLGGPLLAAAATWRDLEWLRGQTRLPILVKGVMGGEDARLCRQAGADGLVVSNHGGRVLQSQPGTLDVLPEIVEAAGAELPVLLDSGVRGGVDIFKALALGARAVLVGRAYVHGLAAAGAPGVAHVLHLLRAELEAAMALTGRRTLAELDASALRL